MSCCIRRHTTSAKLPATLPMKPEDAAIPANASPDGVCVVVVEFSLSFSYRAKRTVE